MGGYTNNRSPLLSLQLAKPFQLALLFLHGLKALL